MFKEAINNYLHAHGYESIDLKAVLFDMDGVLFDSMPNHAEAWHKIMKRFGFGLSREEAYMHEGRTGASTINIVSRRERGHDATEEEIKAAFYELTKTTNLYEYGKDIIYSTERMSLNKNVLNQKYYVVIPYYPEELGENNFDKQEITNMAFSELYTRAQSIVRTLGVCGVNGRVLNSNDLVDLLYVAYNRDDAEVYGVDKAIESGYDELYSTAPDVVDKKMRALNEQIERKAFDKANEKVIEAKSEKELAYEKKEESMDDLIDQMAKLIISQNKQIVGKDIAESAIEKVNQDKAKRKGRPKKQEVEEGGTKRG